LNQEPQRRPYRGKQQTLSSCCVALRVASSCLCCLKLPLLILDVLSFNQGVSYSTIDYGKGVIVLAFGTHGCPAIFTFLRFCSLSWPLARAAVDIIVGNGFFKAQNTSAGSSSDGSCVCRAMELWSRRLGSRRPSCNLPSCRGQWTRRRARVFPPHLFSVANNIGIAK
jgi:hypothetical protein